MFNSRNFVGAYNEDVRIRILDSLSWRVWSEQKRHATLRQNVESVYSASERAYEKIAEVWPEIEKIYQQHNQGNVQDPVNLIERVEDAIVIDERMKKEPDLVIPYIYHTAKQLGLFKKMIDAGISQRDALYIVPKNIKIRTSENYDLINLIDLELPLRLCSTCEPERKFTAWQKRDAIAATVPELSYFLSPKCVIGFCTEPTYCGQITGKREYGRELHEKVNRMMLAGD